MTDFYKTSNGYCFQKKNGKSKRISKELFMKKNMSKKMKGGAFPYPRGTARKLTLMAEVTGETLKLVNQRRRVYELDESDKLHITLLEFWINLENSKNGIFFTEEFRIYIQNLYKEIYIDTQKILSSRILNKNSKAKGG